MDLTKIKEMPIKELVDELKSRGYFNDDEYIKEHYAFFSIIDEKPDYIVYIDWVEDNCDDDEYVIIEYSDINGKSTVSNYIKSFIV